MSIESIAPHPDSGQSLPFQREEAEKQDAARRRVFREYVGPFARHGEGPDGIRRLFEGAKGKIVDIYIQAGLSSAAAEARYQVDLSNSLGLRAQA